jgi:hypothetical protein
MVSSPHIHARTPGLRKPQPAASRRMLKHKHHNIVEFIVSAAPAEIVLPIGESTERSMQQQVVFST